MITQRALDELELRAEDLVQSLFVKFERDFSARLSTLQSAPDLENLLQEIMEAQDGNPLPDQTPGQPV